MSDPLSAFKRWVVEQVTAIKGRLQRIREDLGRVHKRLDDIEDKVEADPSRARMGDQLNNIEDSTDRPQAFVEVDNLYDFLAWVFSDAQNVILFFAFLAALAALVYFLGWEGAFGARWPIVAAPLSLRDVRPLLTHLFE